MPTAWLLVDGYSLLYHLEPEIERRHYGMGLERGRRLVVRTAECGAVAWGARLTVVFDGRSTRSSTEPMPPNVEVVFTPAQQTADSYIERLVCAALHPASICVVASDRAELNTVTAAGAQGMSCRQFVETIKAQRSAPTQRAARPLRSPGPCLGDFFPRMTETMRLNNDD